MKQDLRNKILKKRKQISPDFIKGNSQKIQRLLFSTDEYNQATSILFYISYNGEVSTHKMIIESIDNGKTVIVPKSHPQSNSLMLSHLKNWSELEPGCYNILEPKSEFIREVDVQSIDLIIVPGVVFDIFGNRIGHGKGYYDRLLKKAPDIPSIGLAFEFQMVGKIPVEPHDEKVDRIITENKIIICKS